MAMAFSLRRGPWQKVHNKYRANTVQVEDKYSQDSLPEPLYEGVFISHLPTGLSQRLSCITGSHHGSDLDDSGQLGLLLACTVLACTVFICTVLHCIPLYCCTAQYCPLPCSAVRILASSGWCWTHRLYQARRRLDLGLGPTRWIRRPIAYETLQACASISVSKLFNFHLLHLVLFLKKLIFWFFP